MRSRKRLNLPGLTCRAAAFLAVFAILTACVGPVESAVPQSETVIADEALEPPKEAVPSAGEPTDPVPPAEDGAPADAPVQDWDDSAFDLGKDALAEQDFEAAAEWFRAAIAETPLRAEAYHQLAVCLEALGDIEGAIRAYERLRKVADQPSWRTLAELRLNALRRTLGQRLLARMQVFLEGNLHENALRLAERAVATDLPPALDQRARRKYYRIHAEMLAEQIAQAAMSAGIFEVEATPFVPSRLEWQDESDDFSGLLLSALRNHPVVSVGSRAMPASQREVLATQPPSAWAAEGVPDMDGYFATGRFDASVSVRLVDTFGLRVLHESHFDRLAPVPPGGTERDWPGLAETWRERRPMDVEVWAESERVEWPSSAGRIRPSRDVFASVFAIGEDGSARRLLPLRGGPAPFLRGDKTMAFDLSGSLPPGAGGDEVVALWAVAMQSQFDVPGNLRSAGAISEWMAERFGRIQSSAWASSAYRVRVEAGQPAGHDALRRLLTGGNAAR